jgi:tRNA pseudouridine55 synthase
MGTRTDGLLLVDKPAGISSHDVVAIARRALRIKKIGHAGTLDPFATGLLVLLTGRATRLMPYVDDEPKEYEATIAFGSETDTDDRTGTSTRTAPAPSERAVRDAIASLTGEIAQVPPAYSAKQVDGTRAYDAARRGEPLALAPVRVTVHAWRDVAFADGELRARIACSGGTYIRALARDLGRATGSAAHLAALRRVRAGAFDIAHATAFYALQRGDASVRPPREAIPSLAAGTVDAEAIARIARGMAVDAAVPPGADRAALTDAEGELVAIAERSGERWQPRVVLRDA